MMTAAELAAAFLADLDRCSLKSAAKQCLKDIAARDNPTTAPYERPLILDLPRPAINVIVLIKE